MRNQGSKDDVSIYFLVGILTKSTGIAAQNLPARTADKLLHRRFFTYRRSGVRACKRE